MSWRFKPLVTMMMFFQQIVQLTSNKPPQLCIMGSIWINPPVTESCPTTKASNVENFSISIGRHVLIAPTRTMINYRCFHLMIVNWVIECYSVNIPPFQFIFCGINVKCVNTSIMWHFTLGYIDRTTVTKNMHKISNGDLIVSYIYQDR